MENKKQNGEGFDPSEYLKKQLKYLGFGEDKEMHNKLDTWIDSAEKKLELKTESSKAEKGNKMEFDLKFSRSDNGGIFFNSYKGSLTTENGELREHNFRVTKNYTLTAKEAINLLEGRAVKTAFENPKTNEVEPVFIKLKLDEDKNEYGNYKLESYYKNYGIDTEKILANSDVIIEKEEYKPNIIKSLEKGNIVNIKAKVYEKDINVRAILNPQYKNISLYDMNMVRINTNKPTRETVLDEKEKKTNVKEHNLSRSL